MIGVLYVLFIVLLIEYTILIIALAKDWKTLSNIEHTIAIVLMVYIPIMTYIFVMGMLTGVFIR